MDILLCNKYNCVMREIFKNDLKRELTEESIRKLKKKYLVIRLLYKLLIVIDGSNRKLRDSCS